MGCLCKVLVVRVSQLPQFLLEATMKILGHATYIVEL